MSDETYNILKWIAQVVLPALGTFYFAMSAIWGAPYGEQVVGTITAIDALLGALLGISTVQYNQKLEQEQGNLISEAVLKKMKEEQVNEKRN